MAQENRIVLGVSTCQKVDKHVQSLGKFIEDFGASLGKSLGKVALIQTGLGK